MKNICATLGLITLYLFTSCTPKAVRILEKSYDKCQSIENGYYAYSHSMKYMSGMDTFTSAYRCHFKKIQEDSLFPKAFHYTWGNDERSGGAMYTGNELVSYKDDSTGTITSAVQWADHIQAIKHNYSFYNPIFVESSYPLPNEEDRKDEKNSFIYLGKEKVNDVSCHHIRQVIQPENEEGEMMQTLENEVEYWINEKDFVPIQYTIYYALEMNNDTMYQWAKDKLTDYQFNNLSDNKVLTLEAVPDYITLKDYVPYKAPELLPVDTVAPGWSLPSLDNRTVSLEEMKGDLVLVDFFYKSCYPCMLAIPGLQRLHEKYESQGLRVVGIDPFDDAEEDDLVNFLGKRGVSYTVLLEAKETAKQYHVSGYPTMYLIGRDGKILYANAGYGEELEEKLEQLIKDNL